MSEDFQRLLDGSLDARVRQVLGAGLDDGPSPERVRSAAAALGLSAGAATLAQASASAGAAAAGKPAMALIVLKWLGIGALLGGVTATASIATLSRPGEKVAARSVAPVVRSTPGPAKHAPAARPAIAPEPDAAPAQARTLAVTGPAPSGAAAPQASVASFAAAPADTLRDEIALLDQARRALRGGNAQAALAVLDRYRSAASKHALGTEALLLRVQALVQAGRATEASALGRGYIARHPHDGYAQRLRHLLGIRSPARVAPAPRQSRSAIPSSPTSTAKVPTASF